MVEDVYLVIAEAAEKNNDRNAWMANGLGSSSDTLGGAVPVLANDALTRYRAVLSLHPVTGVPATGAREAATREFYCTVLAPWA